MTTEAKSWREVLPVHPAANVFPMMTADELKSLGDDIRNRGLLEGVALLDGQLLDGRNRLDAMEAVGFKLVVNGVMDWPNIAHRNVKGVDPLDYVISKNIRRRHLTSEQRNEVIAKVVKAMSDKSNRQIAEQVKADHKTIGVVRDKLVARGEIPHVLSTKDTKGREQPIRKPMTAAAKDPIRKLGGQLDAAVKAALDGGSQMRPIIDAIFDHAAMLAENDDPVLFAKRVRQRIDAMERQQGQAQEKPPVPVQPPAAAAAEGIPESAKRQAQA